MKKKKIPSFSSKSSHYIVKEERNLNQELPCYKCYYTRGIYKGIWKYRGRTTVSPKDEAS